MSNVPRYNFFLLFPNKKLERSLHEVGYLSLKYYSPSGKVTMQTIYKNNFEFIFFSV
jgi:hypothetical protein